MQIEQPVLTISEMFAKQNRGGPNKKEGREGGGAPTKNLKTNKRGRGGGIIWNWKVKVTSTFLGWSKMNVAF